MSALVAVVAVLGAVAGLLGLGLAVLAHQRLQRLHPGRAGERPAGSAAARGLGVLTADRTGRSEVAALRAEVGRLTAEVAALRADAARALRHVALVRYDAFADVSGRQSFSAALLDADGDGLVLTTVTGRAESRTYAKGVRAGAGANKLSSEEEHAVSGAFTRRTAPAQRAAR